MLNRLFQRVQGTAAKLTDSSVKNQYGSVRSSDHPKSGDLCNRKCQCTMHGRGIADSKRETGFSGFLIRNHVHVATSRGDRKVKRKGKPAIRGLAGPITSHPQRNQQHRRDSPRHRPRDSQVAVSGLRGIVAKIGSAHCLQFVRIVGSECCPLHRRPVAQLRPTGRHTSGSESS